MRAGIRHVAQHGGRDRLQRGVGGWGQHAQAGARRNSIGHRRRLAWSALRVKRACGGGAGGAGCGASVRPRGAARVVLVGWCSGRRAGVVVTVWWFLGCPRGHGVGRGGFARVNLLSRRNRLTIFAFGSHVPFCLAHA